MELIDQALRGFLVGLLVASIVYYILRPKQPYPRWMLAPFEQPWMLVILIGLVVLLYPWDQRVALLMFLLVVGVGLDILIFGKSYAVPEASLLSTEQAEDTESVESAPETFFEGTESYQGRPLFVIEPPNYPLVSDWHGDMPGSPAPF